MSADDVRNALSSVGYLADDGLSTAVFLSMELHRPLMLEGDAGVGKTELAKALGTWTGGELIRLQCYEGIDAAQAVYDWDYARQLLHLRATEATGESSRQTSEALEAELYDERFLIRRPLLQAIATSNGVPPVLLIDEIDRADDEFEAYLLEILSDYQITVPEIGTFRAEQPPLVILTSNRTRDVHDALKRRCLYHWVEHPEVDREVEIVRLRVPDIAPSLATEVAQAVEFIRSLDLYKPPGIAETIDWAQALVELNCVALDPQTVDSTMGVLLKYQDDISRIQGSEAARILSEVQANLVRSEMKR